MNKWSKKQREGKTASICKNNLCFSFKLKSSQVIYQIFRLTAEDLEAIAGFIGHSGIWQTDCWTKLTCKAIIVFQRIKIANIQTGMQIIHTWGNWIEIELTLCHKKSFGKFSILLIFLSTHCHRNLILWGKHRDDFEKLNTWVSWKSCRIQPDDYFETAEALLIQCAICPSPSVNVLWVWPLRLRLDHRVCCDAARWITCMEFAQGPKSGSLVVLELNPQSFDQQAFFV